MKARIPNLRRRRTGLLRFRLASVAIVLFSLTVYSFLSGSFQKYQQKKLVPSRRALSDDFKCVFNESEFCKVTSCFVPDDFPLSCCLGAPNTTKPESDTACRDEEGGLCIYEELCVAELIPGGTGAAECLFSWESSMPYGLIIYIAVLLYLFLAIAIVADDYFTVALDRIGEGLGLSDDVNGATFAAAGSSAPELFVSLADNVIAASPKSIGIGTIIGSAIFNILVIIGLSALLAELPEDAPRGTKKQLNWRPLARDSVFYVISIGGLFWAVLDTEVQLYEGLVLTCLYIVYIVFMVFNQRFWDCVAPEDEPLEELGVVDASKNRRRFSAIGAADSLEFEEKEDQVEKWCSGYFNVFYWPVNEKRLTEKSYLALCFTDWDTKTLNRLYFILVLPINILFRFTIPDSNYDIFFEDKKNAAGVVLSSNRVKAYSLEFIACIIWIAFLSHMLVYSASKFGCLAGIPPEVMGLTILAAGTSVPDAITSIIYARNGQYDIAIANSLGSNVFDILLGLGLPWFLANIKNQEPIIIEVSELVYSVSFLFGVLLVLLLCLCITRFTLNKPLGLFLCVIYGGYVGLEVVKVVSPGLIDTRIDLSAFAAN